MILQLQFLKKDLKVIQQRESTAQLYIFRMEIMRQKSSKFTGMTTSESLKSGGEI